MTNKDILTDPSSIIGLHLDTIEKANGDLILTDPTNAFTMLLECNAKTTADNDDESRAIISMLYPDHAHNIKDLHHHMQDNDYIDIFAIPAEQVFKLIFKKMDLLNHGYRPEGANYLTVSIPEFTIVKSSNNDFLLLNKLNLRLYDNGIVSADQDLSSSSIGNNRLGLLDTGKSFDVDQNEWILVETILKQLTRDTFTKASSSSNMFNETYLIDDEFHYAEVYYKTEGSSSWTKTTITHSDLVYDINKVTAIIEVSGKQVNIIIPPIMYAQNAIQEIRVDLFTTKGRINELMTKYQIDDFTLTLGENSKTPAESVTNNIEIKAFSNLVLDGGVNGKTFDEIKEKVINNTSKNIINPINEHELKDLGSNKGFAIEKVLDTLTNRIFIANKNLNNSNEYIDSRIDIFNSEVNFIIKDLMDHPFTIINDTTLTIRSNSIFKYDNGMIKILTKEELTVYNLLTLDQKKELLKQHKYFFNLYTYIIDKNDKSRMARIYNLESPEISNLTIIKKNPGTKIKVNILNMGIIKESDGYTLLYSLKGDPEFDKINANTIKGRIAIKTSTSTDTYIYVDSYAYDNANKILKFKLTTDFEIDVDHNLIYVDKVNDKKYDIGLNTGVDILVYSSENLVSTESLNVTDDGINGTILVKQNCTVKFGTYISHLWNKVMNQHLGRAYEVYDVDVPAVYKDKIYKVYPESNSTYKVTFDAEGNATGTEREVIHEAGDLIKDGSDNQIYLHRKGDIKLDNNGQPIVDYNEGVSRFIDVLLLELEFSYSDNKYINEYKNTVISTLNGWFASIKALNDTTLDNTEILFKSFKSTVPVKYKVNKTFIPTTAFIKPVIEIYVPDSSVYTIAKKAEIKKDLGNILHDTLQQGNVRIEDVNKLLKAKLDNSVFTVSVKNIISGNDSVDIINIGANSNRFTINKMLVKSGNDLNIEYDIEIKIIET